MAETTTIEVRRETWRELNSRKEPGDSFDDVIGRLLEGGEDGKTVHYETEIRVPEPGVDEIDLPGRGRDLEERRAALAAVVDHLEAEGRAARSALEEIVDEFDHGYASTNSAWKNCIGPALAELAEVESEGPSGYWRWIGS